MKKEHADYVQQMCTELLRAVPAIEWTDVTVTIAQAITITETEIEVKSIVGTRMLPGFNLDVAHYYPGNLFNPPDVDICDVGQYRRFENAAREAVLLWVKNEAAAWQENESINESISKLVEEING